MRVAIKKMLPVQSFSYSVPYCIVLLLVLFLSNFEKTRNQGRIAVYCIIAVLIVFFGLRGLVQTDWNLYYPFFERLRPLYDGIHVEKQLEPGFVLYSQIFKTIIPDYFAWQFFNTVIDVFVLTLVFRRYSVSVAWSWVFFLAFSGLVVEINLMRNVKAMLIFLLSLPYIEQRNFPKFFLFWVIEMLFHFSSILYLPMYFILGRNFGRLVPLIIFVCANVIFFFKLFPTTLIFGQLDDSNVYINKALGYIADNEKEVGLSFGYIERTAVFFLVYFLYGRLYRQRRSNRMFCNGIYIYYLIWYLFSDIQVFVERFPILFVFSYWILMPNMMALTKGHLRRAVNVGVVLFALMKVAITTDHILYLYDNQVTGTIPMKTRYEYIRRYEGSHLK